MFGTAFLNGNIVAISAISITYYMVIFYATGTIIQNRFKFARSYKTLALPIGFIFHQLLTFVIYSTFLLFTTYFDVFYWIEIIRDVAVLAIVIALLNEWKPTKNDITMRNGIALGWIVFVIIGTFLTSYYMNIYIGYMNRWVKPIPPITGTPMWQTKFQTFIWYQVVTERISSVDIHSNLLITQNFLNIASITLLLTALAKYRREITAHILVPFAVITLIMINGASMLQMTPFMMLIVFNITMLYIYSNSSNKNRLYLYSIVIASTLFMSFMGSGILYSLIFMVPALYMSQKDASSPIYTLNLILISVSLQITLLIYAVTWFGGLISILISLTILVPLNSAILYRQSHSIVDLDDALVQSRRSVALVAISIFLLVSLIMIIQKPDSFTSNIQDWYSDLIFHYHNKTLNWTLTFSVYSIMMLMPLLVYIYRDSNTIFTKYIVIMSFVLFNPLTIGVFNNLFGNNFDFENIVILLSVTAGLTTIDIVNIYLIPKFRKV